MPDVGGLVGAFFGFTIVAIVIGLDIPIAIIGVIIYAIRWVIPCRDPAEETLHVRLARGEIDRAEYQVRLRALQRDDDA